MKTLDWEIAADTCAALTIINDKRHREVAREGARTEAWKVLNHAAYRLVHSLNTQQKAIAFDISGVFYGW